VTGGGYAGTYLGIATGALDTAIHTVKGRHFAHSGTDLDRVPVVQHRIGALWESSRRISASIEGANRKVREWDSPSAGASSNDMAGRSLRRAAKVRATFTIDLPARQQPE
jgi:alkylation response protein AidB-like acyl-CoA dehydrogenase